MTSWGVFDSVGSADRPLAIVLAGLLVGVGMADTAKRVAVRQRKVEPLLDRVAVIPFEETETGTPGRGKLMLACATRGSVPSFRMGRTASRPALLSRRASRHSINLMTRYSLPMRSSHLLTLLLASSGALLASCSSEEPGCGPTDPGCGPAGPTVSAITVAAIIDTVMAVGRTTQLSATATDADGREVSTSFEWSSSSTSVATVNGGGTVSAVGVGSASIEASAESEVGQWSVRVVDADLDGVAALLADPFAEALIGSLDVASESSIEELTADCDAGLGSGDVLAIRTCLDEAVDVESSDAGSDPILAILDLFFEGSLRKLRLDS